MGTIVSPTKSDLATLRTPLEPGERMVLELFERSLDDAWEICLLKFAIDMIGKSSDINAFDFKRKGLL